MFFIAAAVASHPSAVVQINTERKSIRGNNEDLLSFSQKLYHCSLEILPKNHNMAEFSIKYKNTEKSFKQLAFYLFYRNRYVLLFQILGIVLLIWGCYRGFLQKNFDNRTLLAFGTGVLPVYQHFIIHKKASLAYLQNNNAQSDIVCHVNETGMKFISPNEIKPLAWKQISGLSKTKKYLFLFAGKKQGYIIDRTPLTHEQEKYILEQVEKNSGHH